MGAALAESSRVSNGCTENHFGFCARAGVIATRIHKRASHVAAYQNQRKRQRKSTVDRLSPQPASTRRGGLWRTHARVNVDTLRLPRTTSPLNELRVNWHHADSNASLQQALRSMNPAMHGRSFPGERFRANRPESRTWLRTGRSESSSESPGTRESRRMLRQKGECRRKRS